MRASEWKVHSAQHRCLQRGLSYALCTEHSPGELDPLESSKQDPQCPLVPPGCMSSHICSYFSRMTTLEPLMDADSWCFSRNSSLDIIITQYQLCAEGPASPPV